MGRIPRRGELRAILRKKRSYAHAQLYGRAGLSNRCAVIFSCRPAATDATSWHHLKAQSDPALNSAARSLLLPTHSKMQAVRDLKAVLARYAFLFSILSNARSVYVREEFIIKHYEVYSERRISWKCEENSDRQRAVALSNKTPDPNVTQLQMPETLNGMIGNNKMSGRASWQKPCDHSYAKRH